MKRMIVVAITILAAASSVARADESTASVQQALKDQGFYYGDVTGKMDADTTAALRRYQIRSGLKITGEVNAETEKSLNVGSSGAASQDLAGRPSKNTVPVAPRPSAGASRETVTRETARATQEPQPVDQDQQPIRDGQPYRPPPLSGASAQDGIFSGTPYEMAPPPVQREVILGAQTILARRGYYRSGVDGVYGPGMEFSLRAYQSRTGIPPNGRLDMDTLAALGLLPGQHIPGYNSPRRRPIVPPRGVVRGEWVPE